MSTAKLRVVLKADDVVVAESEDPILWQRLLGVLQGQAELPSGASERKTVDETERNSTADQNPSGASAADDAGALQRFARDLKVSPEVIDGALSPAMDPPYLTLNPHNWEAFKKAAPAKGKTSISNAALAGTMLALWLRSSGSNVQATQALTADVLRSIGQRDPNMSRGIKNADWIQTRAGGVFIINPAKNSRALEITRAFCEERAPAGDA